MTETVWVPGENCDVMLGHYGHELVPLVCYRTPADPLGPRVRLHFETYWPSDVNSGESIISRDVTPSTVRCLFFTVLADDYMLCPDGGEYSYSADQIRQKLNAIMLELTDIDLYTQSGIISGLYCTDHAMIETIYQQAHTLEINLSTRNLKDIPIGPGQVDLWLPSNTYQPYSRWNTSHWK